MFSPRFADLGGAVMRVANSKRSKLFVAEYEMPDGSVVTDGADKSAFLYLARAMNFRIQANILQHQLLGNIARK